MVAATLFCLLICENWRNLRIILFRDYLRSNPAALAEYNELKRRHADDDADGYWLAKNAFFENLLIRPRPWA